jgi:drug/metabolite transporter (DMT)-like permease
MVRRGRAANVASLMLLVPPLAAAETYLLFGDRLTVLQLAGFAIALGGVLLCNPAQRARVVALERAAMSRPGRIER